MADLKMVLAEMPRTIQILAFFSLISFFWITWFVAGALNLRRLFKFGLTGIISALFDFGFLNLTYFALDKNPKYLPLAVFAGYLAGAITNYLLVSRLVFKNYKNYKTIFLRFMVIVTISLGLNELFVLSLTDFLNLYYNLAKLISIIIVFFWNYTAFKKWVFVEV